jgi:hypothetical protein
MTPIRAFYSLVQYVPDSGRAEGANAGVALFVPSAKWIDIRSSQTLERVRKFFAPGRPQLQRIELALEALKNRIALARDEFKDESDFAHFIAARADAVRLSAPRLIMVSDPSNDLNSLFNELVGDHDAVQRNTRNIASLPPRLAEVFGRLVVEKRAWRPRSIIVPTIRRRFPVSMAYQNGVINYVRAESLARGGGLESRLERLGFNGQLIHQHKIDDMPGKLIVLSSDRSADPEMERWFQTALEEFSVRFVPSNKADEFAAEVEQTAH